MERAGDQVRRLDSWTRHAGGDLLGVRGRLGYLGCFEQQGSLVVEWISGRPSHGQDDVVGTETTQTPQVAHLMSP